MVVSSNVNWPRILRQIGRPYLAVIGLSIITSVLNYIDHPFKPLAVPNVTLTLLGAALGILLGFRTSSAYDRWWEARKLWGQLVNSSRTLARQAVSFVPETASGREWSRRLVYEQIAFVHALRLALRKEEPWAELQPFVSAEMMGHLRREQNVPAALLHAIGLDVARAAEAGMLSELRLQRLDATLTDLANVQGGCERIKNTPLPRQYDVYPEMFVKAYCLLLPLTLVDELQLWTPVATAVISFAFLVLNRIGKNLEDPFDSYTYGTPLTSMSRMIEINLRQALGETQLPAAVVAERGVLP